MRHFFGENASLHSKTAVASALILISQSVSAAFIVDGNYVLSRLELKAGQCPMFCSPTIAQAGSVISVLEEQSLNAAGRETHAAASVRADGRLEFKVKAGSSAPAATSPFTPTAQSFGEAIYRDVILPTAAGAPTQLSLKFSVHGELQVSNTTDPGGDSSNISQAFLPFGSKNDVISFAPIFTGGTNANVQNNNGGPTEAVFESSPASSWLSASFTELAPNHYEFNGVVERIVDLNIWPSPLPEAPFGAYFVNVGLGAYTFSRGSTTLVDATNTAVLSGISLADGSPLPSGFEFTLESGASYAPVPLPPSIALLLLPIAAIFRAGKRTIAITLKK